jgi:hypothetical protein
MGSNSGAGQPLQASQGRLTLQGVNSSRRTYSLPQRADEHSIQCIGRDPPNGPILQSVRDTMRNVVRGTSKPIIKNSSAARLQTLLKLQDPHFMYRTWRLSSLAKYMYKRGTCLAMGFQILHHGGEPPTPTDPLRPNHSTPRHVTTVADAEE